MASERLEPTGDGRAGAVFSPAWPEGLVAGETYTARCDDDGHALAARLDVTIGGDGDVWLRMSKLLVDDEPRLDPWPCIRVRTLAGGGRQPRTRQALLWLAQAIRRDAEDGGAGYP